MTRSPIELLWTAKKGIGPPWQAEAARAGAGQPRWQVGKLCLLPSFVTKHPGARLLYASCVSSHQENATTCGNEAIWSLFTIRQYGFSPIWQYGLSLHSWDCPGAVTCTEGGRVHGGKKQPTQEEVREDFKTPFSLCQTTTFLTSAWTKLY